MPGTTGNVWTCLDVRYACIPHLCTRGITYAILFATGIRLPGAVHLGLRAAAGPPGQGKFPFPAHIALPHLTAGARQASDCRALYIRGYAPLLDPLATNATQLVVDVAAASVVDACGERFPGTSITTSVRSR